MSTQPEASIKPSAGQIWQDCDPRIELDRGCVRLLRIISVDQDGKATCEAWYDEPGAQSRTVRIRLDRFTPTSTGYKFVRNDPETETADDLPRAMVQMLAVALRGTRVVDPDDTWAPAEAVAKVAITFVLETLRTRAHWLRPDNEGAFVTAAEVNEALHRIAEQVRDLP